MTNVVDFTSNLNSIMQSRTICGGWINVLSHLDPRYGGLSAAVPALSSVAAVASRIDLCAFCRPGEHFRPHIDPAVTVYYFPAGRIDWIRNRTARHIFGRLVAESRGVHVHGLWELSTTVSARSAHANGKPYVVSAHGMLEPWALANKGRKKRVYAALFERSNLQKAACLHALTPAEARDYRSFGLRNPIAIVPNGIELPKTISADAFFTSFPQLRGRPIVLYLGRLHFKKGLDILCQAWSQVAAEYPDAVLVLAGPNFENTKSDLQNRLSSLGIAHHVVFTGLLINDLKWSALAAARMFVLPSYSEGLSISVLEAMACGVPVIVTEQCNLPDVARHSCGWVIRSRADDIADALLDGLRASSSYLAELGSNGRRLVARRYTWPIVGNQMSAVYHWLEGGPKPHQVELWDAA